MTEPSGHYIPRHKRIIKERGGMLSKDGKERSYGGRPMDGESYVPYVIDTMPRTAFRIFHYNRKGYLERDSFYFHSIKGLRVKEGKYGVLLSFYADNRAVTFRGGGSIHAIAEAIEDCTLETVTVFHPEAWDHVPNDVEAIDRIAIDTLPIPGQEKRQPMDGDDFDDDDLPGEKPLN